MDVGRAQRQLRLIAEVVAMSEALGVQVWLRGGWAMEFYLGQLTRDLLDIDWFAWAADAEAITAGLHAAGYQSIPGPPPDQQLDVTMDGGELSFAWLAPEPGGPVTVGGGPRAGEPGPRRC